MLTPIIWIIIGMAIVTYIPRMIPLVVMNPEQIHPKLQGILKNVPYAILGALIFPAVFTVSDQIWFGTVGAIAAFLAAYLGASLIFVVLISIGVLSVISFLF